MVLELQCGVYEFWYIRLYTRFQLYQSDLNQIVPFNIIFKQMPSSLQHKNSNFCSYWILPPNDLRHPKLDVLIRDCLIPIPFAVGEIMTHVTIISTPICQEVIVTHFESDSEQNPTIAQAFRKPRNYFRASTTVRDGVGMFLVLKITHSEERP